MGERQDGTHLFAAGAGRRPLIDFSGGLPSPEALMSYEPDLIVLHTETYAADGTYEKYAKIAPTYVFKMHPGMSRSR